MNTMCTAHSCSLVEARNFKSAFTLAHEIGHSLGMEHDGVSNGCDQSCCVMSPIISAGQLWWSTCSNAEWQKHLYNLSCRQTDWYCLEHNNYSRSKDISLIDEILPGQKYSLDDQCRMYFGFCYRHQLRRGTQLPDICKEVWCTQGGAYLNASHSALEGTYCSPDKWCRRGKCVLATEDLPVTHGHWGSWTDSTDKNCGNSDCSPCQIANQTRIRRQIRTCDKPSPLNGGNYCEGPHYRGVKCTSELCSGMSVKRFANLSCEQMRNQTDLELSGEGLQRLDTSHSCSVWCLIKSSYTVYTFFQPFPDGTKCSESDTQACVAGECQEIVADPHTTVKHRQTSTPELTTTSVVTEKILSSIQTEQTTTDHSDITQSPMIENTIAQTTEKTSAKHRHTSTTDVSSTTTIVTTKSSISRSPGSSKWTANTTEPVQLTSKKHNVTTNWNTTADNNYNNLAAINNSNDVLKPLRIGKWSSWGSWSSCTAECDGGVQTGTRRCGKGAKCLGANTKMRVCNMRECP